VVGIAAPLLLFPHGLLPWVGLGLIALGWIMCGITTGRWLVRTPLDLPVATILLTALVGLCASSDLALSAPRIYGILLGIAVYYATVRAVTARPIFWLGIGLLVACIIPVAAIGAVGVHWPSKFPALGVVYNQIPHLITEVQATSGAASYFNPNELGGTLVFLVPLPLALLLGGGLPPIVWPGVALAALVGVLEVALAASRTSYGTVAVLVVVLLIWRWRWRGFALVLVLMAASVFAVFRFAVLPPDFSRSIDAFDGGLNVGKALASLPLSGRQPIWSAALGVIRDFPFTGAGLNTFDAVLKAQYPAEVRNPAATLVHAHNVFLQAALDMGLVGLLGFVALFVGAALVGWQAYRRLGARSCDAVASSGQSVPTECAATPGTAEQTALVGLLVGLAAYLIFGLTDAVTLGAKPTVLLWLLIGLVVAADRLGMEGRAIRRRPLTHGVRFPALVSCFLLPVAALAASAPLWLSPLYVNLGRVELGRNNYAIASVRAREALRWNGTNSGAYLLDGIAHFRAGEDTEAVERLERAVALDGANREAHYYLAEACYRLGEEDAAVKHWRAAEAGDTLLRRAAQASGANDLPQAERWYSLATRVDPSRVQSWLALAQTIAGQQRWQDAADVYAEMIEGFPDSYLGYEGRASLLQSRLKDVPGAIATLDLGIARADDPKQLYYLRSVYQAGQGKWIAAEEDARQAIALAPRNGGYLSWLGDLYFRQKRYDDALAQYDLSGSEASDHSWIWRAAQRRGAVYATLKDWTSAIGEYRHAVDVSIEQGARPTVVAANYVQLGINLAAAGRAGEAASAFQTAVDLDPNNRDAAKRLEDMNSK